MGTLRPQSFAALLRDLRRNANLTQEELADRAGLSPRTISDLERGVKSTPQSGTLDLIAVALDLSPGERDRFLASVPARHNRRPSVYTSRTPITFPADLTPLVGRERDEAAAIQILHRRGTRLLTLVGPGGVGKTRLAIRVATTLADEYAGATSFISLAGVNDPLQVPSHVYLALGVKDQAARSVQDGITDFIGNRSALLVLDNFEQVAAAAGLVSSLLESCARLTIIATSRAPLHVRGEHLLDVPPLICPAPDENPSAKLAMQFSAVSLFVQRARAARADFELTDDLVGTVAAICRRLDNLPLALELAAAQTRHLPAPELLRQLEHGVDTLPPGPIDAPARQRTIVDTLAWSYELLNDDERELFRSLSVFAGGFRVDAAQAVAAHGHADVAAGLAALADKSLLFRSESLNDGQRFHLLESVREHSRREAQEHNDFRSFQERHAGYFVDMARTAGEVQRRDGTGPWSTGLKEDHENLLSALQWLAEGDRTHDALVLAGGLVEYWILWGYVRQGREWLETLIAKAEAGAHGDEPVEIPASALVGAARLAWLQNDYQRASVLYETGLAAHRRDGNDAEAAVTLNNIGTVAHLQNDYDRAVEYYELAAEAARACDHAYGIAMPLSNLGIIAMQRGDLAEAATLLDEGVAKWREIGNERMLAVTLGNRGSLAFRQSDYGRAAELHAEALAMKRAAGDTISIAHSAGDLAWAQLGLGDLDTVGPLLSEALATFHGANHKDGVAECIEAFAALSFARGDPGRAAGLYGSAAAIRDGIGVWHHPADLARHEASVAQVASALGQVAFDSAWTGGSATPVEAVLELVSDEESWLQVSI